MADDKRFEIIYKQRGWDMDVHIVIDKSTGVNYLMIKNGTSVATLTPLLGADGRPVITPNP